MTYEADPIADPWINYAGDEEVCPRKKHSENDQRNSLHASCRRVSGRSSWDILCRGVECRTVSNAFEKSIGQSYDIGLRLGWQMINDRVE